MSRNVIKYICQSCGYSSVRWLGKCPGCEEWNTFAEEIISSSKGKASTNPSLELTNLSKINEIDTSSEERTITGISEFDRVMGGGIVAGSVTLIGGDPGIGKSTIMMQIAQKIKDKIVLYVSGEESPKQIKMRSARLGLKSDNVYILSETSLEVIGAVIERLKPEVVII